MFSTMTRAELSRYRLAPNFTLGEAMASQTALRYGYDNRPVSGEITNLERVAKRILQPVRDHFGIPFSPSSWFRSRALNKHLGGSETSDHMNGCAVDFEVPGIPNLELAIWVRDNLEFDQLILEFWDAEDPAAGWVHASLRVDDNRGDVLRYDGRTFLGGLHD